jgi:hypothetical protein
MKIKQLIEYVQQHHPHMAEAEIINRANRILKTVSKDLNVKDVSWTQNTTAGQRYYPFDSTIKINSISRVYLERKQIPRIEKPVIEDSDEPGAW